MPDKDSAIQNHVKFSIIVPVYNTGQYLRQCVDSVLSQEYENLELILVNDGSTDDSGKICEEYAKKESRAVYICKKNGGVSSARNAGIRSATGEYIIFLDSDDWICGDIFGKSNQIIADTGRKDIYIGDFYRYNPENDELLLASFMVNQTVLDRANPYEVLACVMWSPSSFSNVRRLIFKRDVMIKNNVFFDEALSWSEDTDFFVSYILECKSFGSLGLPVSYYRIARGGSLTAIPNPELSRQGIRIRQKWCEYFVEAYGKTGDKSALRSAGHFANELFDYIMSYGETMAQPLLKENGRLLKYTSGWKMAVKKALYGSIGYSAAPRIVGWLKKLRAALVKSRGGM